MSEQWLFMGLKPGVRPKVPIAKFHGGDTVRVKGFSYCRGVIDNVHYSPVNGGWTYGIVTWENRGCSGGFGYHTGNVEENRLLPWVPRKKQLPPARRQVNRVAADV